CSGPDEVCLMSKSRSRSMGRSLAAAGAACLLFAGATFAHDTVTGATSADPALNQWHTATAEWDETDRGEVADANDGDEIAEADECDETDRGEVADADDAEDAAKPAVDAESEDPETQDPSDKADENDQGEDDQGDDADQNDQGDDDQGENDNE